MQPSVIIARHPSPILKQKGTGRMAKPDPTGPSALPTGQCSALSFSHRSRVNCCGYDPKGRGVLVLDGPTPHHLFGNTPNRKGIGTGWEGAPSGESRRPFGPSDWTMRRIVILPTEKSYQLCVIPRPRTCLSKEVFPTDPDFVYLCGDFAKNHDGMVQWNLSTERLIGQRERWRQDFARQYAKKEELWQKKYDTLISNKNIWMTNAAEDAVSTGARSMAVDFGIDADQLIGEVSFSLIPDMTTEACSASEIVSTALSGTTVYRLLDSVRSITSRTGGSDVILSASLPSVPDTTREVANLTEKQNELKEDLQKALAMARARQMVEMLEDTEEAIDTNIDDANYQVDASVDSTLSSGGYARRGNIYDRTIIIDSTLWGDPETEHQTVGAYKDFEAPEFDHGIDLSESLLEDLNSTLIQARVQLAQENMMNYLALIFGQDDAERDGLDKNFLALLDKQEKAFKNSAQYNMSYTDEDDVKHDKGKHTETQGLFNYYVGYAPIMEKKKPEKVKTKGYGEMGRIYKDYMVQQARLYRGLSTVDAPWYNQKLWDDDADNDGKSDGFMGAPTMRTVSDIAMTVASSFVAPGIGGVLMGAALNMVDDAVFTTLDIANGMDAGDAWGSFGKKAATSVVTQVASYGLSSLDSAQFLTFDSGSLSDSIMEVTSDIGIAGTTTAVNTYSGAAIESIGSDGFSWGTFNDMTSWDTAGVSYLSSMAGAGVTSGMETGALGFINEDKINTDALSRLSGGLTTSSIEYAMTGSTKLNLANIHGTGVLELNIGDSNNIFNLGTGGTDLSYGTLSSAYKGIGAYAQNRKIREAGVDRELRAAARTLYSA